MPSQLSPAPKSIAPRFLKPQFICPAVFFLVVLLVGIFIFPDYGISTDEQIDNLTGLVNARYIVEKFWPGSLSNFPYLANVPELYNHQDRHYGVIFQLPAAVLPYLFGLTDVRDIFLFRHFFNFLFYFAGLVAFYKILEHRFRSWQIALLGSFMLLLSPRIFADGFYNSKDIIFLALMAGGWYTLNHFRQKLQLKWTILHAIVTAAALDTRIMALSLLGLTYLWLAHELFYARSNTQRKRILLNGTAFTLLFVGFAILFWPYLWSDPIAHFLEIFARLDRGYTFDVLYWGKFIPYNKLPWHYVPSWLVITTPLIYTCYFLAGLFIICARAFRQKLAFFHTEEGKQDFTAIFLLLFPLLVIIGTKAILYDGWRHMFFVYIPFLYLAVLGLVKIFRQLSGNGIRSWQKGLRQTLAALTLISLAHTSWLMIKMHPYQNVYFSFLSADYVTEKFERDYWGLSYREALEFILKNDPRPEIKVAVNFYSGSNSTDILKPEQTKRLKFVPEKEADYFLTEYRWHPEPYPHPNEIHKIEANGLKIMSVFKLK